MACRKEAAVDVDHEDVEENLTAHYEVETFEYCGGLVDSVSVLSATCTVGSNIVDDDRDRTGLMVWPATHLLCQHLSSGLLISSRNDDENASKGDNNNNKDDQVVVLELGCGCGLAGVTATLAKSTSLKLWVSTDMDEKALELCHKNYELNGVDPSKWQTRLLEWGNPDQVVKIQQELAPDGFAAIVAADIVYPATCGQVLQSLLERTVDPLLAPDGSFWLSFATRDGFQTPQRLVEAASRAGFRIRTLPPLSEEVRSRLPPLLDAQLLVLERSANAARENEQLGGVQCNVFPGLKEWLRRRQEDSSSDEEEWDAPYLSD